MKPLLLALLTGGLFALSLPPFDLEWLGWAALAPLLIASQGRRPLEAFGLGMIAGAFSGVVQAGWHHDTARLFCAYIPFLWLSFLFGAVALTAAFVPASWNPARRVLLLACAGVSGEWLTSFLPLPLNVPLCQYRNLILIQIASVAGIWGVSFLLWGANAALVELVLRRKLIPAGAVLSLVLLSLGCGAWQLAQAPTDSPTLRVAAIQDLTGAETGDLAPDGGDVDRATMTRQVAAQGAKLVVWSEEAFGTDFAPNDSKDETRRLAQQLDTALVVGYSDRAWPKPFNCAAYIASNGKTPGPAHHKIHLYLAERETNQSGHTATVVDTPQGRLGLESALIAATRTRRGRRSRMVRG